MNYNAEMPDMSCTPYVGMPIYLDDMDEFGVMPEMNDTMMGDMMGDMMDDMMGVMPDMMNGDYQCSSNFEHWPLAMAYVPWQGWGDLYEPSMALSKGTIFPCLDLPFLGGGMK